MLDLEESELQQDTQSEMAEEKARRSALHRSANLKDMDSLLEDIMIKGDGDMTRLRSLQPFQEPLSQLRDQVDALTDEYIATVLAHKDLKTKEHGEFTTCGHPSCTGLVHTCWHERAILAHAQSMQPGLSSTNEGAHLRFVVPLRAMEHAKGEAASESKAEIGKYTALAKQSLSESSENPVAILQTLHKANDALFERLMDLEVSQSERYAESISTFESSYDELTKRTFEVLQAYFGKLRDLETAYHERLIAAGSELLERVASDHADNIPEEARALLQDKDTVMGVINAAHDARVARLDAKVLPQSRRLGMITALYPTVHDRCLPYPGRRTSCAHSRTPPTKPS